MRVLGVGSPLLDLLARVEEPFLEKVPGAKGGMELLAPEVMDRLLEQLADEYAVVPGGAAGNTVFGLARLGVPVGMLGKTGKDAYGEIYRSSLVRLGGSESAFFETDQLPTGRCLALITPDGERTMRTFFGASSDLTAEEVETVDFSAYDLVYIEGYQLFHQAMIEAVFRQAKAAGCRIGLDLASFEVVGLFREWLLELLKEYVDLVFANEDEATALLGDKPAEQQARELARFCEIAAVKLGPRGSLIASGDMLCHVPADVVKAVDTTAAGDLWASGFLFGYLHDRPLSECGRYASMTAREVVQVVGSKIPEQRWEALCRSFQLYNN